MYNPHAVTEHWSEELCLQIGTEQVYTPNVVNLNIKQNMAQTTENKENSNKRCVKVVHNG